MPGGLGHPVSVYHLIAAGGAVGDAIAAANNKANSIGLAGSAVRHIRPRQTRGARWVNGGTDLSFVIAGLDPATHAPPAEKPYGPAVRAVGR
jgi:hypothetical protein